MARTDILLDPENIEAIAADGSFNLSTTVESDPDIRLIPKRARLVLGGSTSEEESTPDGEIWLATSEGEEWARRIDLSASGAEFAEETVLSAGTQRDAGRLDIGRVGDVEPTVTVNAERGHVRLNRIPEDEYPYDSGDWEPQGAISLDAKPAHIIVGGGNQLDNGDWIGKSGSIELRDAKDNSTVNVEADGEGQGGKIRLSKSTELPTAVIDGGTGTMVLGAAAPSVGAVSLEAAKQGSENGEVWLDDGTGRKFGLKAENGVIGLGPSSDQSGIGLVLKPEEGVFGIVDDNGNFVFRVDTEKESIEVPSRYNGRGAFDIERRIRKNGQGQ
jgi:hypothetical protein